MGGGTFKKRGVGWLAMNFSVRRRLFGLQNAEDLILESLWAFETGNDWAAGHDWMKIPFRNFPARLVTVWGWLSDPPTIGNFKKVTAWITWLFVCFWWFFRHVFMSHKSQGPSSWWNIQMFSFNECSRGTDEFGGPWCGQTRWCFCIFFCTLRHVGYQTAICCEFFTYMQQIFWPPNHASWFLWLSGYPVVQKKHESFVKKMCWNDPKSTRSGSHVF